MQIDRIHEINQSDTVGSLLKLNKRTIFIASAFILLFIWVNISYLLSSKDLINASIVVTMLTFIFLGYITIEVITPRLPKKIRNYMIIWTAAKIILSTLFFSFAFVIRDGGISSIYEYGDSFTYHRLASSYTDYWSTGILLENPISLSSQAEQWGYGYFLGLLYHFTGQIPENGIIVNGYLFLVFCLLSYKLYTESGLSQKDSITGMILLSFFPALWMWSSYLYKESLLFVVVLFCILAIFKINKKSKLGWLLFLIILQIPLITLRYTYVFIVMVVYFVSMYYMREKNILRNVEIVIIYCLFLFMTYFLVENLLYKYGVFNLLEYSKQAIEAENISGGRFLTEGIGKSITINNFFYVLPVKAIYILMSPFPWFGGTIFPDKIYFIFSHFDAIYICSLLIAAMYIIKNRKRIPIRNEQKILFIGGIAFLLLPLFMYDPTRRYISMSVPFLVAYTLPVCKQNNIYKKTVIIAVGFAIIIQLCYYLIY